MYPDNYMNPMNNPMTNPNYGYNRMQQVQQMQNPQTAMQHMFGNDPKFQQAMKMAQGKTPDQLKETAFNLAKTQGIDPKQIMGVLSNFGIKI